ncbi:MAG: ketoacyl-ACP synthase III [Epsilonproteobacteria bacterium]|nr:ketoacyl-ACP synthase III [Campylobacterota bacterium]
MYAKFASIGAYVPQRKVTNFDLEKIVDTSDEWITKRTGIKTRYFVEDETTSDLAVEAGKIAIKRANLQPSDIDMVIVATITPDYFAMPSTACVVAENLGIKAPAFDISAACTGFIYALSTAKAFIQSGMSKNVLIIGAEALSKIIDFKDRTTCVIFGDGAGAAVISATENKDDAILDIDINADGSYQDYLITPGRGVKYGCETDEIYLQMKGNETFKVAVKTLSQSVRDILERNNMTSDDIEWFIPHQANYRIIDAVARAIKMPSSKSVLTVGKYGNTSSASIPMAINDMFEEGKLKKGDMMLLDAFGGGFTWGSALVPFGGENS